MKCARAVSVELPLRGGGRRETLLLEFALPDGRLFWGEAAPWPGWSRESVTELEDHLARSPEAPGEFPSLRLAFEMAAAEADGWTDWPVQREQIPLNALLRGSAEQIEVAAREKYARGCRCYKIKTGEVATRDLVGLVRRLASEWGDGVQFRLDPNRAWSFSEALEISEQLAGCPVEYLEEPLSEASLLPDFLGRSPLPVALDESLREIEPRDLARFAGAAALVLKPTLMGGLCICREFALAGAALGMQAVISSCYESGLTLYALARLAANLPNLAACGFDPYEDLLEDLVAPRWQWTDFSWSLPTCSPQSRIRADFIG